MKSLRRPHRIYVVVVSILILSASFYGVRRAWRAHRGSGAPALRVLCAENWIDPEVTARFARETDARIDLYTYANVAELLRQLANADGRVDVVCTSSLLLRSLIRSHWIRRDDFADLAQARGIAADFLHLPFDPGVQYALPINWLAFGFWSARAGVDGSLKSLHARGRVGAWASDLNLMALLTQSGVSFAERLESEGVKKLEDDVQRFVLSLGLIAPDLERASPSEWAKRFDFAHVPSILIADGLKFGPGEDGGVVDLGLVAVGERATSPELARRLIERLIDPEVATAAAARLKLGTVHEAGETDPRFGTAARASALRTFALTKLRFPDVNAEATLKFARTFANARARK